MRKLMLVLGVLTVLQYQVVDAQNTEFPNAIRAKVNLSDFQLLADANEGIRIGPGFELAYLRNISPFVNIGLPVKMGVSKFPGTTENKVTASGDLIAQVLNTRHKGRLQPFAFTGLGYFFEQSNGGHMQIPIGAGLNLKMSRFAYAHIQAEYRYAAQEQRNNLQAGLGFVYLLHKGEAQPSNLPADTDKDGTPDNLDKCPNEPGPAPAMGCPDNDNDGLANSEDDCPNDPGPSATKGCPDYDNDGTPDKDDKCPTDAGPLNGCPDNDKDGVADNVDKCPGLAGPINGCPDRDGDGIADNEDKCPDTPGSAATKGCPAVADDDQDGVPNNEDLCPQAAGPVKYKGCPDSDGDEVADNEDKCPNTVGPKTNYGCPEVKQETKERLAFAMKAVQFETARATLKTESYAILEEIIDIMAQYPDYKLKISGHTDNIGDEARNLQLSTDRAKACHDYFLLRRVDAKRISFTGYGEGRPMSDNNTPAGRELNRRVEFELTLD